MHELAFTEGIIKVIETEAKKQGFSNCIGITLSVGKFSGIVPGCIEDFFPIAAKGTIAEKAVLHFNEGDDPFKSYIDNIEVE